MFVGKSLCITEDYHSYGVKKFNSFHFRNVLYKVKWLPRVQIPRAQTTAKGISNFVPDIISYIFQQNTFVIYVNDPSAFNTYCMSKK